MDKYVAQLQQDTGATPKNIVEAAGGGGGGQFIITVTSNDEQTELYVDKTYQEIASAYAAGKTFYFSWYNYPRPFAAPNVVEDDGTYYIWGTDVSIEPVSDESADISLLIIYVTADSANGVTANSKSASASGFYSFIPPFEP